LREVLLRVRIHVNVLDHRGEACAAPRPARPGSRFATSPPIRARRDTRS
jgi:hypothetical protein